MRVLSPALVLLLRAVPKQAAGCLCSTRPADGPGAGPLARARDSGGPGCLHNTRLGMGMDSEVFIQLLRSWLAPVNEAGV